MIASIRNIPLKALAAGAALLIAGCENTPLEVEEHPEAGGVVIFAEGTRNVLAVSVGARAAFDRPITVPLNGSLEVEVRFLDDANPTDYDRAFLPHEDEGESLEITIANPSIVSFEAHGDHADFRGLAAGTTTASFDLVHGGHSDFASGTLTINVQ